MSKLAHSNPFLNDVLHEGNAHLALGGKNIGDFQWSLNGFYPKKGRAVSGHADDAIDCSLED